MEGAEKLENAILGSPIQAYFAIVYMHYAAGFNYMMFLSNWI